MRSFLGMGSNLGDRRRLLADAVVALPDLVAVSPLYESEPVGGPPDQPWFLNLVAELSSPRSPRQLLSLCQELEGAAGRERAVRFGPRTLDVDVLLVDDLRVDEPDLVVPHPRMWERRFVLRPLADLAPELVAPEVEARSVGRIRAAGTLFPDGRASGPGSGAGSAAVGG
ncbi:MAG: 2-amino-4-hydroxy-6-hydroxymethyldihydropteridine diphosphokinase [Acidimicrobiales bacterium]|nr:2-amino-4-hydroxy-6-hydroxymethyldihydropteridine diphosphokinase [Acidimicrobiales bacterium]MBO0893875.1 2-amino-4-hydroxy-6-hydroxymethyldihydropteridine diphosphokinase [Acidimicrobiales bacterium]